MNAYKVLLTPAAHNDLKEARAWYRKRSPDLPKRLTQQVNIAIENLRSLPVAHAVRYRNVRIAHIAVFPYAIHYIIEQDSIVVLAVHHTAINPDKWEERI